MTEFESQYAALRRTVIGREFERLNPMQREAVFRTEGPLLLLAGAGSGKTTVLINRVINLLRFGRAYYSGEVPAWIGDPEMETLAQAAAEPQSVPDAEISRLCAVDPPRPWEIIAITFTNKAAGELRDRLTTACGPAGADIWAHTFHTACTRILRKYIDRLGYDRSFTIYDDDDQKRLMTAILKELRLDEKRFDPRGVLAEISRAKDELYTPKDYASQAGQDYYRVQVAQIYLEYQRRLKSASALDFDDIIVRTVELLQTCDDVREEYQRKFRYVLVDEYQDTNHAQYVLCSLLAGGHHNLCVVGDDDQSIYKFRGATIANILEFEEHYKHARTIRLEQNYRSTGTILDAANHVIANNRGRKGKTLWTENGAGTKVKHFQGQNQDEESMYIGKTILQEQRRGAKLRDFAVLYRNNALSNNLQTTFARLGIPFAVVRGHSFLDSAEVRDVRAYLELIHNPADDQRLRRILNVPARRIGPKVQETLLAVAAREGKPLLEIAREADKLPDFTKTQAEPLTAFAAMIYGLAAQQDTLPLMELYDQMLEQSGYLTMLKTNMDQEKQNRLDNVLELKSSIEQYGRETDAPTLAGFLEGLSLVSDVDTYDPDADAVSMMTMHSAKGLEFPVVFVCGMEEGLFPSFRAMDSDDELEEERRLCYVALTRAKRELHVTEARSRLLYGQTRFAKPSRFIDEIPAELKEDSDWHTPGYTPPAARAGVSGGSAGVSAPTGSRTSERASRAERAARPARYAQRENTLSAFSGPARPAAPAAAASFRAGQRIRHRAFGPGTVRECTPMGGDVMLRIAFDNGAEKLMMARTAAQFITAL